MLDIPAHRRKLVDNDQTSIDLARRSHLWIDVLELVIKSRVQSDPVVFLS